MNSFLQLKNAVIQARQPYIDGFLAPEDYLTIVVRQSFYDRCLKTVPSAGAWKSELINFELMGVPIELDDSGEVKKFYIRELETVTNIHGEGPFVPLISIEQVEAYQYQGELYPTSSHAQIQALQDRFNTYYEQSPLQVKNWDTEEYENVDRADVYEWLCKSPQFLAQLLQEVVLAEAAVDKWEEDNK